MKAGTTDVNVGTRVRITDSNNPDLIDLTGTITHPFRGLMCPDGKYMLGIRLDKEGVFVDNIANLLEGDKFEITHDTTDSKDIPRKWEYIADQLREHKAPAKVVNAAVESDNAMVKLGLGYHTEYWTKKYPIYLKYQPLLIKELYDLVTDNKSCSACEDCGCICSECKLGQSRRCTPRNKHADLYFTIVKFWVAGKM
jgi:hypothetical protein